MKKPTYYIQTNDPAIVVRFPPKRGFNILVVRAVRVLSIASSSGKLIPDTKEFNLKCPLSDADKAEIRKALAEYGPGPVEKVLSPDFNLPVAVRLGKAK